MNPDVEGWLPEVNEGWLQRHRAHHASGQLRSWRRVARAARLKLTVIHETAGYPVIFLTTVRVSARPLYFSSGVHGDEAGSVLGLLEWAERSVAWLRQADAVLFPLFNPAGLVLNTRADAGGADLNRLFDHAGHPHPVAWREAMSGYRPRLAVCLHEDYDAQGLYAYELNRNPRRHVAEFCLGKAQGILPRDRRSVIEGRPARQGIIQRSRLPMFENLPEAVALYQNGTPCTLTFETPSEFSLATRARAQARLLQAVCEWDAEQGGIPAMSLGA